MPRHAAVASCIAILMHSKRKDSLDAMQQASRFGYESHIPQMRSQWTLKRQIVLHRRTAFDQGVQITSTAEDHAPYVQRALDLGRERRAFLAKKNAAKVSLDCGSDTHGRAARQSRSSSPNHAPLRSRFCGCHSGGTYLVDTLQN